MSALQHHIEASRPIWRDSEKAGIVEIKNNEKMDILCNFQYGFSTASHTISESAPTTRVVTLERQFIVQTEGPNERLDQLQRVFTYSNILVLATHYFFLDQHVALRYQLGNIPLLFRQQVAPDLSSCDVRQLISGEKVSLF